MNITCPLVCFHNSFPHVQSQFHHFLSTKKRETRSLLNRHEESRKEKLRHQSFKFKPFPSSTRLSCLEIFIHAGISYGPQICWAESAWWVMLDEEIGFRLMVLLMVHSLWGSLEKYAQINQWKGHVMPFVGQSVLAWSMTPWGFNLIMLLVWCPTNGPP